MQPQVRELPQNPNDVRSTSRLAIDFPSVKRLLFTYSAGMQCTWPGTRIWGPHTWQTESRSPEGAGASLMQIPPVKTRRINIPWRLRQALDGKREGIIDLRIRIFQRLKVAFTTNAYPYPTITPESLWLACWPPASYIRNYAWALSFTDRPLLLAIGRSSE